MKKLISLLSILFVLALFVPPKQAEAFRGGGWLLPGLIVGGAIGWSLAPRYYYPPAYYYPPPTYYYPPAAPPAYHNPPQGKVSQTSFDPTKPPVGAPDAQTIQKSGDYLRAISACLDARGYTVR